MIIHVAANGSVELQDADDFKNFKIVRAKRRRGSRAP